MGGAEVYPGVARVAEGRARMEEARLGPFPGSPASHQRDLVGTGRYPWEISHKQFMVNVEMVGESWEIGWLIVGNLCESWSNGGPIMDIRHISHFHSWSIYVKVGPAGSWQNKIRAAVKVNRFKRIQQLVSGE